MIPISFVFITRNEEVNIGDAIRCVAPYADQILVFDQQSEDGTPRVAISTLEGLTRQENSILRRCRVEVVEFLGVCEYYRQPTIEICNNDWVFVLDADERLPPGIDFDKIVMDATKTNKMVVGFPRSNIVTDYENVSLDNWLGDDVQYRLLHRKYCYWPVFIHSVPQPIQSSFQVRRDFTISHFTRLDRWPIKNRIYNSSPTLWGRSRLADYHSFCFQRARIEVAEELQRIGRLEPHRERLGLPRSGIPKKEDLPEVWLPPGFNR